MNKKHYKVIFSQVLNQLVVVSELAKSKGKAKEGSLPVVFTSVSTVISCKISWSLSLW